MQVNKKMLFLNVFCHFHLLREKSCPNLPGTTWKNNCPLLLNQERTVINHIIFESWVKLHLPNRGLIHARPDELRNHLNRTGLTKWSMVKHMPRSKEIQEQMRNKTVDMYQSGKGYKAISKPLGLQRTMVRAIIHEWKKRRKWWTVPGVAGQPKLLQEHNDGSSRRS